MRYAARLYLSFARSGFQSESRILKLNHRKHGIFEIGINVWHPSQKKETPPKKNITNIIYRLAPT